MNRPCEHLKNLTEAMSVAEINRLLYLPDHPRQNLERALPIPAPSSG